MTVSDATDALSNSNKQAGADIFIWPSDGNFLYEDSADEEGSQLYNLSRRQLLALCELQLAAIRTDEMVVTDQVERIEMISSSDKMSLLPSNVNCWVKSKNSSKKQRPEKD